ncbi:MAG: hypothetical protein IJ217_01145 [Clostridia bacterium]|nr:hypothetical protein [Clostridia bacterium]
MKKPPSGVFSSILQDARGISLVALIVTIIVIIILAAISITINHNVLNSTSEAKFKSELRGMMDRLKIYHEKANLASVSYRNTNLEWDGLEYYATNTGKVENGSYEDSVDYIFGGIPAYFQGKLFIKSGIINVDTTKFSTDELAWIREIGLSTNEFYEWQNLDFDGDYSKVIVTDINLFSEAYIEKDFEIKIVVEEVGEGNVNQSTILNAKLENGSTYPGIVLRYKNDTSLELAMRGSKNDQKSLETTSVLNKEIIIRRTEGVISYQIGNGEEMISQNNPITETFDSPLVIGCSIAQNNAKQRPFIGKVGYISVTIFDSVKEEIDTGRAVVGKFERYNLVCDKTHNFNSEICLYSEENINRDFKITLKIKSLERLESNSTIVNSMFENQAATWPGFVFRYDGNNNVLDIRSVRTSLKSKIRVDDIIDKEFIISREDGHLYYQIGSDGNKVEVPYNPVIHNTPVTFGCSLKDDLTTPQRPCNVVFEYVKIELYN